MGVQKFYGLKLVTWNCWFVISETAVSWDETALHASSSNNLSDLLKVNVNDKQMNHLS